MHAFCVSFLFCFVVLWDFVIRVERIKYLMTKWINVFCTNRCREVKRTQTDVCMCVCLSACMWMCMWTLYLFYRCVSQFLYF